MTTMPLASLYDAAWLCCESTLSHSILLFHQKSILHLHVEQQILKTNKKITSRGFELSTLHFACPVLMLVRSEQDFLELFYLLGGEVFPRADFRDEVIHHFGLSVLAGAVILLQVRVARATLFVICRQRRDKTGNDMTRHDSAVTDDIINMTMYL